MAQNFKSIRGGVTAPKGFKSSGICCGVKDPTSPKLDLGILFSEYPTTAAATFTTNKVKAAPVRVSATHIRNDEIRAVIVNSGNANACTGPAGIADARKMTKLTAKEFGFRQRQVFVCSTGIIGVPMPMDRLVPKIGEAVQQLNRKPSDDFAEAIMTSDTVPKSVSVEIPLSGGTVRIGGVAKGAGMICPNMATMLCFITTDACVSKKELQTATAQAVEFSFNRITVDGDMSTNDTVLVMANGASEHPEIKSGSKDSQIFREALDMVMLKLAKMMVRDGEKVTKFVELTVKGAATHTDARRVARSVARSTLVKCSWNGSDPNWGRIMDALGYAKARIREELIEIHFGGLVAAKNGIATETPLSKLHTVMKKGEISICIDLNLGDSEYTIYTTDFTKGFVDFNRTEFVDDE